MCALRSMTSWNWTGTMSHEIQIGNCWFLITQPVSVIWSCFFKLLIIKSSILKSRRRTDHSFPDEWWSCWTSKASFLVCVFCSRITWQQPYHFIGDYAECQTVLALINCFWTTGKLNFIASLSSPKAVFSRGYQTTFISIITVITYKKLKVSALVNWGQVNWPHKLREIQLLVS